MPNPPRLIPQEKLATEQLRPFASVLPAVRSEVRRKRVNLEIVGFMSDEGLTLEYDRAISTESDIHMFGWREARSMMPADGRVEAWIYDPGEGGLLAECLLTLKEKQVVAIDGQPVDPQRLTARWGTSSRSALGRGEKAVLEAEVRSTAEAILDLVQRMPGFSYSHPPQIRCSTARSRTHSLGGPAGISIALRYYRGLPERIQHHEYSRIRRDPEIGALGWIGWRDHLKAVVAHEMAHWVHLSSAARYPHEQGADAAPHGRAWQEIYRIFRRHLGLIRGAPGAASD